MPTTPPERQIENPDPQSGTNNVYTNDGYGNITTGKGGSYSNCADSIAARGEADPGLSRRAPRTSPIRIVMPGHYYLLNNYNPGYLSGRHGGYHHTFAIPPTPQPSIGDVLLANSVSFAWFGEGWNQSVAEPTNPEQCLLQHLQSVQLPDAVYGYERCATSPPGYQ